MDLRFLHSLDASRDHIVIAAKHKFILLLERGVIRPSSNQQASSL